MVEVISAVCLYLTACIIFSHIYIFTISEHFKVRFILNLNKTGNFSFTMDKFMMVLKSSSHRIKFYVVMKKIYKNLSHAGNFGGVNVFYSAAKGKVSKKTIQKWLSGVDSYTLHKHARKKFPTNRDIVYSLISNGKHMWRI